MNQLRVYSPVKGSTGYDHLARDLLKELVKKGISVELQEFFGWSPFQCQLDQESHQVLSDALLYKLEPQVGAVTNLNICLPEQVKLFDNMRNINLTMFEADSIIPQWADFLENVDEIIVPTDFNQWSFTHKNSVPPEKVKVLPLGYDPERYNTNVRPLPLVSEGKSVLDFPIRFLIICEITDRKNFWGTLQTFYTVAARVGVERCCAVLKVGNYSRNIDLQSEVKRFKEKLIEEKTIWDLPYNIFNYVPILPEAAHANFIAIGTHYLSTSFGEGWDMTAMQAAACGLNLFVPMHSAYQCWLQSDCVSFLPIAKKMKATQGWPTGRLYENSSWYAYNMPSTIDLISSNLLNPSMLEEKQHNMQEFIKQYQWANLIDDYIEALHL